jgi:hypothetical protein
VTNNASVTDWSTADCHFEDCVSTNAHTQVFGTAVPIICWGDAVKGNPNRSMFIRCTFLSSGGNVAASIEQADGLTFIGCHWGDPGGGRGHLILHANNTGVLSTRNGMTGPFCQARSCVFLGCEGPITAKASTDGGAHTAGHISYGYTMENVNAYPVIESGADLTVYTTSTAVATNPGSGCMVYGESLAGAHVFGSTQLIANDALTGVVWSDTDWDPLGASNGGQIFVPPGLKWARATAQIIWAPNTSGWRYVEIAKNLTVMCREWAPNSIWDGAQLVQSHWFRVGSGDNIKVNVKQGSGGSLPLSSASFLQVEFK